MATKARESRKPITEPNDLKKPRNQTAKTLASNKSIHKKATNIVRTKDTSCKPPQPPRCPSNAPRS